MTTRALPSRPPRHESPCLRGIDLSLDDVEDRYVATRLRRRRDHDVLRLSKPPHHIQNRRSTHRVRLPERDGSTEDPDSWIMIRARYQSKRAYGWYGDVSTRSLSRTGHPLCRARAGILTIRSRTAIQLRVGHARYANDMPRSQKGKRVRASCKLTQAREPSRSCGPLCGGPGLNTRLPTQNLSSGVGAG